MKYLGIDYGQKRVGVAISDAAGTIAFPRAALQNGERLMSQIVALIGSEKVGVLVVGDTRAFSGLENPVTVEAERFIERLKKETGLPVIAAWEAGSSLEASRYAEKGDEHKDEAAAAIILQRFLDMRGTA